jgi:hypothetical protein
VGPHVVPHGGQAGGGDGWTTALAVGVVAVGLLFGVGALVYWGRRSGGGGLIRIASTPPGEAPEEIRRAWVGLELPLARGERGPRALDTEGVLSREGSGVDKGYVVDGKTAVKLLASCSPAAADWWRENAPHVVASGYQLIFPENVCERMDSVNT